MNPSSPKDATKIEAAIERWTVPIGNLFVSLFHRIALFGIGAATVWSAAVAFLGMVGKGSASIEDLLLLFKRKGFRFNRRFTASIYLS